MMSTPSASFSLSHSYSHPHHPPQHSSLHPRHHSASDYPFDIHDSDSIATDLFNQQIDALLAQSSGNCLARQQQAFVASSQPHISLPNVPTPTPLALVTDLRHDSLLPAPFAPDCYDLHRMSMGETLGFPQAPKRARTHQRTPSASTVASNGPVSPFSANTLYPYIASADVSPNSPLQFTDLAFLAKNYPTEHFVPGSSYMPGSASNASHALGMKGFPIDNSNDDIPDFAQSSRLSMSTNGNNSPATPLSGTTYGEVSEGKNGNGVYQNDLRQHNPQVHLYRTESQAYADELYNPATTYTSTPAQVPATAPKSGYLSPHRNVMNERLNERLQVANQARSASPLSSVSRERSPFRDGSPLAPAGDWRNASTQMGTAAGMRQRHKEQTEQAEYAQHIPQMRREPTKTISPKDAVLDYTEADQPPLFQESIPAGYRQHGGGAGSWQNHFAAAPGSTFGNLSAATTGPQMAPFSSSSSQAFATAPDFNFMQLSPDNGNQSQIQAASLQPNNYSASKMNFLDANPEFPPSLVTMESSMSENAPAPSSQESGTTGPAVSQTSVPRPADTRANTGTYSCPYHGCPQRFESPNELQKHKKDYHRALQQQQRQASHETASSTGHGSVSPRSSESPERSESGMTAVELAARNSQAGPHKCTRINPSTGKPCNTVFSRPYDLTRHEGTIHNNRKQKVRCPMCREEKTFSRSDALTRHMRVVHPEVESYGKRGRRGE